MGESECDGIEGSREEEDSLAVEDHGVDRFTRVHICCQDSNAREERVDRRHHQEDKLPFSRGRERLLESHDQVDRQEHINHRDEGVAEVHSESVSLHDDIQGAELRGL